MPDEFNTSTTVYWIGSTETQEGSGTNTDTGTLALPPAMAGAISTAGMIFGGEATILLIGIVPIT